MNESSRYIYPVWPGWETVRLIGRGSYGAVYEIQRDVFGEKEKAALKVITIPQSSSDIEELYGEGLSSESITDTFKDQLKNIVAEYSLMRKMNGHSNVVNCDDMRYVQHTDGIGWDVFIKMELLTPLVRSSDSLSPDERARRIGTDLCRALSLCRKYSIIHRDIKPQNIFLSPNGDYKLGDFGIAKTIEKTTGGTKIGTYEYMAPEVYHDEPYGAAADIYSLGMVLYWVLNKRRTPFLTLPPEVPTPLEKEAARKRRFRGEALPPPVDGGEELKRIVLKACSYDPKDRYQSPEEMLKALENVGKAKAPGPQSEPVPEPEAPLKPTEPDEDKTVSAAFGAEKTLSDPDATVSAALGSEPKADDATVSALDDPVLEPVKPAQPPKAVPVSINPAPKKKKGWLWIAALAAVAGIVLFLICGQGQTGAEMSSGAGQTIPDGNYMIVQTYDQNSFLDIPGVAIPANFEDNVWLCSTDGEPFQPWDVWTVRYVDEGGFYEICQMDTEMALDVYYSSMEKGGNIQVSYSNGTPAQRWSISSFRDGWRLQAKCSGFALEIVDLNAQQGPSSYTNKTQCWTFIPYEYGDGFVGNIGGYVDQLSWNFNEITGELFIRGHGSMIDFDYSDAPWKGLNISSVSIADGVTSIGIRAFYDCTNLTSVSIPESVTAIGKQAFGGCDQLVYVFFSGSEPQWKYTIAIDEGNYNLINSRIHFAG